MRRAITGGRLVRGFMVWLMTPLLASVAGVGLPPKPAAAAPGATVAFGGGGLEAIAPTRILDTRVGVGAPQGVLGAGQTISLEVTGVAGLPATGVGTVVLNVTAVDPTQPAWVTVWPAGAPLPLASNLNLIPGEVVPNLVVVKVGAAGRVNLSLSHGNVHLVADLAGWFPEGPAIEPLVPTRVLDTRFGTGAPASSVGPDGEVSLQIAGVAGIPESGVGAVVLNVTSVDPTAGSWVTVWPDGEPEPLASNLNLAPGVIAPNLVIAKVGANGRVRLSNAHGSTHLVADIAAWLPDTSPYEPLTPARILDTRSGLGAPQATVGAQGEILLQVTGRGGVPVSDVGAVVLNVTAVDPDAASWVTVWPAGESEPLASNLNLIRGRIDPNLVVVKVGDGGQIRLSNEAGSTHLVADVAGWFPAAADDSTSYVLHDDTVVGGPGDLVSVTGDSDAGATVVLAASADVPVVGGQFVAFSSATAPQGLAGIVTGLTSGPGGTSTATLSPATLQEVFVDLDIGHHGLVEPLPEAEQIVTAALEASCSGSLPFAPSFSLDDWNVDLEFDLLGGYFELLVGVTPTATWAGTVTGSFTCTLAMPVPIELPVGPMTLSTSLYGSATASATASASMSLSAGAPITIGARVDDGVVTNLSDFDLTGDSDIESDPEVELSASLELGAAIDGKAFGVGGLSISFGVQGALEASPFALPCLEASVQPVISLAAVVGRWGVEWSWNIASVSGPRVVLLEQYQGCPAAEHEWRGTMTFEIDQDITFPDPYFPIHFRFDEAATLDVLGRDPGNIDFHRGSVSGSGIHEQDRYCVELNGTGTLTSNWVHNGEFDIESAPIGVYLEDGIDGTRWGLPNIVVATTNADECVPNSPDDQIGWVLGTGSTISEEPLVDSDPAPDRLAGTTVYTLADPPITINSYTTAYVLTVTYDLTRFEVPPPPP